MSYSIVVSAARGGSRTGRPYYLEMGKVTRQKKLSELISRHGECSIELLAQELGVSDMTIRRDLQVLADAGKVIRTHGGAAMGDRVSFEFKFLERTEEHRQGKEAIAKTAASRVEDGQAVLLDSGTTTLAVASELKAKQNLTVITTSLPIAARLQFSSLSVLLLGGYLRDSSPDLAGAMTESNLDSLRADIAFLGTQGIDSDGNLYQATPELASLVSRMSQSAKVVYVVADGSKLGKTALSRSGRLQDYQGLITDPQADPQFIAELTEKGVKVLVARGKSRKTS